MSDQPAIKFKCESCGKAYRVPMAMAGRSGKCKACGAAMRVPKPQPRPEAEEDVFSIDDLQSLSDEPQGGGEQVFSIGDLQALGDTAPPEAPAESAAAPAGGAGPVAAPFSFQPAAKPARRAGSSSKQGLAAGLSSMWQAFTAAPDPAGQRPPAIRRVSMGGLFLLLGSALLVVFSTINVPPDEVAEARGIAMANALGDKLPRLTPEPPLLLFGLVALIAGLVTAGRRAVFPRAERESPLVLIVFWAVTLLLLITSCVVLFGGMKTAGELSQLGGVCVLLSAVAFGVWVLYKLTHDGDGSGVMMIIFPSAAMPIAIFLTVMFMVPADRLQDFPWGQFVLYLFLLFLALCTMGGAISFLTLVLAPFMLADLIDSSVLAGKSSAMVIFVLMCLACYVILAITRWRLMIKPVAWQLCILLLGGLLMGGFQKIGADHEALALRDQAIAKEDAELTRLLRAQGMIPANVTASHQPFSNSGKVEGAVDRDEVAYLSSGGVIVRKSGFHESSFRYDRELTERLLAAGMIEPGVTASHDPFPNSGKVNTPYSRDKIVFLSTGRTIVRPGGFSERELGLRGGRPIEPDKPAEPIFSADELPRGVEAPPRRDGDWPVFSPPAKVNLSNADQFACWGYRLALLPGYRVTQMSEEDNGVRKLVISGPQLERPKPALELLLVPQPIARDGTVDPVDWETQLRAHGFDLDDGGTGYGRISAIPFARGAPDTDHVGRYRSQIVYVSQDLASPRSVVMRIPSYERSGADLLKVEAMARSLRRIEPAMAAAPPDPADVDSTLIDYTQETLDETRWRIAGAFAHPDLYGRADSRRTAGMGVQYTLGSASRASITIDLMPAGEDEPRAMRVQRAGAETLGTSSDAFDGKTVYAYGGKVEYEKLWGDALFVRVERGTAEVVRGTRYERVSYYGWLGGYWAQVHLRRNAVDGPRMGELEAELHQIRLANAVELVESRADRGWVPQMLRNEPADLPLAGGTTVKQAFILDQLGNAKLSPDIDPDTGRFVPVYPAVDAQALRPYKTWSPREEMDEHLSKDPHRLGPLVYRPLSELKASSRNSDRRVEWFASTRSGRVSISMRVDPVGEGETPLALPVTVNPQTGKVEVRVGGRTLKPATAPQVSYRESRGLRVWRVLMPQVGGSKLRRCYYLAEMPGRRLTISADFEHDQQAQLMGIDASIATLVYKPLVVE